jgi:GNAT superfamily N-acetyltransferase
MPLGIRRLTQGDVELTARAFAPLGKPHAQYEWYLEEQGCGERVTSVAASGTAIIGYTNVVSESDCRPFQSEGIPEIQDLNAIPEFRRRGVASALIARAEREVAARRKQVVGAGVG